MSHFYQHLLRLVGILTLRPDPIDRQLRVLSKAAIRIIARETPKHTKHVWAAVSLQFISRYPGAAFRPPAARSGADFLGLRCALQVGRRCGVPCTSPNDRGGDGPVQKGVSMWRVAVGHNFGTYLSNLPMGTPARWMVRVGGVRNAVAAVVSLQSPCQHSRGVEVNQQDARTNEKRTDDCVCRRR